MFKGGFSQLEIFDFKEGFWIFEDLVLEIVMLGFCMLMGLLLKLVVWCEKYLIICLMEVWEVEHVCGVYYIQVGCLFSLVRVWEIFLVGAIVVFEIVQCCCENDYLFFYFLFDLLSVDIVGVGCLVGQVVFMVIVIIGEFLFVVFENECEIF